MASGRKQRDWFGRWQHKPVWLGPNYRTPLRLCLPSAATLRTASFRRRPRFHPPCSIAISAAKRRPAGAGDCSDYGLPGLARHRLPAIAHEADDVHHHRRGFHVGGDLSEASSLAQSFKPSLLARKSLVMTAVEASPSTTWISKADCRSSVEENAVREHRMMTRSAASQSGEFHNTRRITSAMEPRRCSAANLQDEPPSGKCSNLPFRQSDIAAAG